MPTVRLKDGLFSYEKYGLAYYGFRVRVTQHGHSRLIQRQGFRTKRRAAQRLHELRVSAYLTTFDPQTGSKHGGPFERHLARYAPVKPDPWGTASRRDKHRYTNQRILYEFWQSHLGALATNAITDETIATALRTKTFRSPATYNQYLIFIKKVWNQECRAGRLATNPTATLPKYPKVKQPKYQFSPEQEDALLAKLDPFSQDLVRLGLYSGMRISEVFELKKTQIDLEARRIILPDPKAREPQVVRLSTTCLPPLRRLLDRADPDSPWLLPSPKDPQRPRDTSYWRRAFLRPALQALGLDETHSFHETRKTYTARLLAAGTPTAITKLLTRHKTLEIVEDYAAWYEHQLQDVLERSQAQAKAKSSMTKSMTGKTRRKLVSGASG